MGKFLTQQEIVRIYNGIVHDVDYLKQFNNHTFAEHERIQVLEYAKEVRLQSYFRKEGYDTLVNFDFGFPYSPAFDAGYFMPDGEYIEPSYFTEEKKIEYWYFTSQSVIDKLTVSAADNEENRTLADVALQLVWEGQVVTYRNRDDIARMFPELNLKNGTKLYNKFNFYSDRSNRCYDNDDEGKNRRHLKNMYRALKYLKNPDHIQRAEKDILDFKKIVKEKRGQNL